MEGVILRIKFFAFFRPQVPVVFLSGHTVADNEYNFPFLPGDTVQLLHQQSFFVYILKRFVYIFMDCLTVGMHDDFPAVR